MLMSRTRLFIVLLAGIVAPGRLQAQAVSMSATCSEGWSTMGALGITEFTCDCTFDRGSNPAWRFRGEPTISGVSSRGPAAGRLRSGDVLVAIDGMLITTRAAGARLASLKPGSTVTLTIRRGNREIEVRLTPDEPCVEPPTPATPAAPVATTREVPTPRPPRVSSARSAPTPRTPPVATTASPAIPAPPAPPAPTAWFGFGISCRNCEMNVTNYSEIERAEAEYHELVRDGRDNDSPAARAARARIRELRRENTNWRFSEYPTLFSVDRGSPAYQAGLRRGDVLMKIDGLSLLTVEGASRFGQVEPGQTVEFTYRRGGSERSVRVKSIEHPGGGDVEAVGGVAEAAADLERLQSQQSRELQRLHESLAQVEGGARSDAQQRELAELRAELDRINSTHRAESQVQLDRLREELALVEQTRALTPAPGEQHLRFAGSVGNTEVEVRGLSSVDVSYDNSTGELLIRTIDAIIRVKAPVRR